MRIGKFISVTACALFLIIALNGNAQAQEEYGQGGYSEYGGGGGLGPQGRPLGLGLVMGSYFLATGKYWLNSENALQFQFGEWSAWRGAFDFNNIYLSCEYLWHFRNIIPLRTSDVELPLYVGAGGGLLVFNNAFNDGIALHIKGVAGISLVFNTAPFDIFFEIVPHIFIGDIFDSFEMGAVFGGRYYF